MLLEPFLLLSCQITFSSAFHGAVFLAPSIIYMYCVAAMLQNSIDKNLGDSKDSAADFHNPPPLYNVPKNLNTNYLYRLPKGPILAKDLAIEYKYLSNTSEWFFIARKRAESVIQGGRPQKIGKPSFLSAFFLFLVRYQKSEQRVT